MGIKLAFAGVVIADFCRTLCGCWYGGAGRPKELEEAATSLGATRLEPLPGHPAAHRTSAAHGLAMAFARAIGEYGSLSRATCPWSLKSALIIIVSKLDSTTLPGTTTAIDVRIMLVIFCCAAGRNACGTAAPRRRGHIMTTTPTRPVSAWHHRGRRRALIDVRWYLWCCFDFAIAAVFTGRCAKHGA
jgi:ABC-type sulfate transport system permease component